MWTHPDSSSVSPRVRRRHETEQIWCSVVFPLLLLLYAAASWRRPVVSVSSGGTVWRFSRVSQHIWGQTLHRLPNIPRHGETPVTLSHTSTSTVCQCTRKRFLGSIHYIWVYYNLSADNKSVLRKLTAEIVDNTGPSKIITKPMKASRWLLACLHPACVSRRVMWHKTWYKLELYIMTATSRSTSDMSDSGLRPNGTSSLKERKKLNVLRFLSKDLPGNWFVV